MTIPCNFKSLLTLMPYTLYYTLSRMWWAILFDQILFHIVKKFLVSLNQADFFIGFSRLVVTHIVSFYLFLNCQILLMRFLIVARHTYVFEWLVWCHMRELSWVFIIRKIIFFLFFHIWINYSLLLSSLFIYS